MLKTQAKLCYNLQMREGMLAPVVDFASAIQTAMGLGLVLTTVLFFADRFVVWSAGRGVLVYVDIGNIILFIGCWIAAGLYHFQKVRPSLANVFVLWISCWAFFLSAQAVLFVVWPSFPSFVGGPGSFATTAWGGLLTLVLFTSLSFALKMRSTPL